MVGLGPRKPPSRKGKLASTSFPTVFGSLKYTELRVIGTKYYGQATYEVHLILLHSFILPARSRVMLFK